MQTVEVKKLAYPYMIAKSPNSLGEIKNFTRHFTHKVELFIADHACNPSVQIHCYFQYKQYSIQQGVFTKSTVIADITISQTDTFIQTCQETTADPMLITYHTSNGYGVLYMVDPSGYIESDLVAKSSPGLHTLPKNINEVIEKVLKPKSSTLEYSPRAINQIIASSFYSDKNLSKANEADAIRSMSKERATEFLKYWPKSYSVQSLIALNPTKQHSALGLFPGSRQSTTYNPQSKALVHIDETMLHSPDNLLSYGHFTLTPTTHRVVNVSTDHQAIYFSPEKKDQYLYNVKDETGLALYQIEYLGGALTNQSQSFSLFEAPQPHLESHKCYFFNDAMFLLEDGSIYPVSSIILSSQDNGEMFGSDIKELEQKMHLDASQYASAQECWNETINKTPENTAMLFTKNSSLFPTGLSERLQALLGLSHQPCISSSVSVYQLNNNGLACLGSFLTAPEKTLPLVSTNPLPQNNTCLPMSNQQQCSPVNIQSHLPKLSPHKKSRLHLRLALVVAFFVSVTLAILERHVWMVYTSFCGAIAFLMILNEGNWLRFSFSQTLVNTATSLRSICNPAKTNCTRLATKYNAPSHIPGI
ncbi:hypothetical protein OAT84_03665 [Gammaproteobacteria bacterium]|nr:hypothetical protein [Gammaproteobacteria bacterium]